MNTAQKELSFTGEEVYNSLQRISGTGLFSIYNRAQLYAGGKGAVGLGRLTNLYFQFKEYITDNS